MFYPTLCQSEVTCHFLNCIFKLLRSTVASVMITSEINVGSPCFWNDLEYYYMYNITCILNKKIMAILAILCNIETAGTISLLSSSSLITSISLLLGKTDYIVVISLVVSILRN